MEDDKTPASPRKRTAKAAPTDTSEPSATTGPTAAGAGRTPRPRKVPPATFVSPGQPSQPVADAPSPNPASPAAIRQPAKKPPAKKAAKKAQGLPENPAPAQPAVKAPAKKAAAKKAAPKKAAPKVAPAAAPAPPTVTSQEIAERPAPVPVPAESTTPVRPASLWPTIKANPGYATELLALAAVSRLGPQARTDLRWLRDTYPNATTHGLARMAMVRSVRQVRTQGAVAGLLGPVAVLAEMGVLLWTQARLVLDIAAAYGRDPADPERAVELLTLLRVHPDLTAAREAITAARRAAAGGRADPQQVTLPVVRVVGRALGRMAIARRMARVVPGAGAALTAILDGRATEQLAVRAAKFYRS